MNHRAELSGLKAFLNRHAILIPFVVLAVAVAFAFWLDSRNSAADDKARCVSGVDSRNVDRDQTFRFYVFVRGILPTDEAVDKLPQPQKKQTKAVIAQLEDFRDQSFAAIKPSTLCEPYVDDDNVTPEQWAKDHPPTEVKTK